jgi:hypothetical protein
LVHSGILRIYLSRKNTLVLDKTKLKAALKLKNFSTKISTFTKSANKYGFECCNTSRALFLTHSSLEGVATTTDLRRVVLSLEILESRKGKAKSAKNNTRTHKRTVLSGNKRRTRSGNKRRTRSGNNDTNERNGLSGNSGTDCCTIDNDLAFGPFIMWPFCTDDELVSGEEFCNAFDVDSTPNKKAIRAVSPPNTPKGTIHQMTTTDASDALELKADEMDDISLSHFEELVSTLV